MGAMENRCVGFKGMRFGVVRYSNTHAIIRRLCRRETEYRSSEAGAKQVPISRSIDQLHRAAASCIELSIELTRQALLRCLFAVTSGHLQQRRALPCPQLRQQDGPPVGKFDRIMVGPGFLPVDLPEPAKAVRDLPPLLTSEKAHDPEESKLQQI